MQSSRKKPRTHRFGEASEDGPRVALRQSPRHATRGRAQGGGWPADDGDDALAHALGMAIDSLELLRQVMEVEPSEASEEPSPPYDIYPVSLYPTGRSPLTLESMSLESLSLALDPMTLDHDGPEDATPLHLAAIRTAAEGLFETRTGAAGFALSEDEWLSMLRQRYCA